MRTRRALLDSATKALLRASSELGFPLRARLESELLLSFVLEVERIELHSHPECEVSEAHSSAFQACIARRAKGEPIEYITKRASFYGRDFYVDSAVLIPRPESELLVDEARALIEAHNLTHIAEVGVGSGAVIGTLARFCPQCECIGTDISAEALAVARRNVGGDIALFHCSLLEGHSALSDKGAIDKARGVDEPLVLSPCSPCQSPDLSSQILECQGELLPKDSESISESTASDSRSISESTPHASLESKADSENPSGEARPLRDKNKIAHSRNLESVALERGKEIMAEGGGSNLANLQVWISPTASSSPSPLDEKENAINEVLESKKVKAKDSEKVDLESQSRAESARVEDSEKWNLESNAFTSPNSKTSSIALSQKEKGYSPLPALPSPEKNKASAFSFRQMGRVPRLSASSSSVAAALLPPCFNASTPRSGRDSDCASRDLILSRWSETPPLGSSELLAEEVCLSACNEGKHTAESRNEGKTESNAMFAPQIQLIISNPPYIARDYPIPAPLRYEPAIALFSGEDGLDMLRELIAESSRRGVWLLCEIGYDQKEGLEQILGQSGAKEWRFYKDFSGLWRGFVARF